MGQRRYYIYSRTEDSSWGGDELQLETEVKARNPDHAVRKADIPSGEQYMVLANSNVNIKEKVSE